MDALDTKKHWPLHFAAITRINDHTSRSVEDVRRVRDPDTRIDEYPAYAHRRMLTCQEDGDPRFTRGEMIVGPNGGHLELSRRTIDRDDFNVRDLG